MRFPAPLLAALCAVSIAHAAPTPVARDGVPQQRVIISEAATPRVKAAAAQLAALLARITGSPFAVVAGNGATGLAVGLPGDFPTAPTPIPWDVTQISAREDYLLRSHPGGVRLLGASELAVEHAVWDFLERLGYRQFFPGPHWEIIPQTRELSIEVETHEHPDLLARRIWYGFGGWDISREPYRDWCAKNRAVAGFDLKTGHSYEGIIHAHQAVFAGHPEYLALVGGVRKGPKLCISNPGLRALVVENALAHFAGDPEADSISLDPSDGGGWCECAECAKLGSVSDQALFLANTVAAAVNARYPGKVVGMYAYNYHSPPPSIRVHPQVAVSVATAFVKGGSTFDELLHGWAKQGARLGIREYYSVNTWDRDLPGSARGSNLAYLQRTIPHFFQEGARYLSAESSDNWGPNGLGYYLAARMLWDVREAGHLPELTDDFLTRAFGAAREPMREFYRQLDGSQPHLVESDQLGRMYRALAEAHKLEPSGAAAVRLTDLALYARYVELYHTYAQARDASRQEAFEALVRHAYRMRNTGMVHSQALYRDLAARDKTVKIPPEATWKVPEGKNPWKSTEPFTGEEVAQFIVQGIEHNPLTELSFQPVTYSDTLVSAAPLKLPESAPGEWGPGRGRQVFYTRVDAAPAKLELTLTGGLIEHYRDRGNVQVQLWKMGGASETGEKETLAGEDRSVPPDGQEHPVALAVNEPGLYRLEINDGKDSTRVKLVSTLPFSIKSSQDEPMSSFYGELWNLYFYVPRGTRMIGLFGGEHGEVRDSADRPIFWLNGREPNFYGVPVPEGEDGKLWHIRYGRGAVRLLTVPPYFARTAAELLLPTEVVARDAR